MACYRSRVGVYGLHGGTGSRGRSGVGGGDLWRSTPAFSLRSSLTAPRYAAPRGSDAHSAPPPVHRAFRSLVLTLSDSSVKRRRSEGFGRRGAAGRERDARKKAVLTYPLLIGGGAVARWRRRTKAKYLTFYLKRLHRSD
ncbi:hypothetical protein EYF80_042825 [Liparis tanakae]|uniref:Uncharacterized protein n=1 Tax=Liparis tanakae TaxID=230148 RepID=A0A4Z2G073_9TELE|nr:hypothetical protein EYF80_042825 [Liparis tanakae]